MRRNTTRKVQRSTPRAKSLYIAVQPVGSKFAKALQQKLQELVNNNVFRVDHQRGRQLLQRYARNVLFSVTQQTKDKIEQFRNFAAAGVSCPRFATSEQDARALGCKTLFARTLVNSTGGKGIVEFDAASEQYPRAPLYTEYIPKKAEYRVHVFHGEVIDVQQKKKKRDFNTDDRDTRVRNLANGYVYTRDGIVPPAGIGELAINAVNAVGYQYGAVDIIYNEKRNQCFVLEVNSRPGLMGTTLDKYADALVRHYDLWRK